MLASFLINLYEVRKRSDYSKYRAFADWKPVFLALSAFGLGIPLIAAIPLVLCLNHWRNHTRKCPNCGAVMRKVDEVHDNDYLTPAQDLEERIGSVDYDVWLCPDCGETDVLPYTSRTSPYIECDKCHARTARLVRTRVVERPTARSKGKGVREYECLNCHHRNDRYYDIAPEPDALAAAAAGAAILGSSRRSGGFSGGFGGGSFGGGFGGFGRGFGGGFIPNQINNDANTGIILQALERNGVGINNLATALGTSKDAIMTALNGLSREICNFSNQTGVQTNQIITALLQGNNALTSQIASCCCDLKGLIAQLGCNIEKTIIGEGSATRAEIAAARNDIKEGQRAQEMREMQREIDALRESKSDLKTKLALKDQNDFVQASLNAGLQPLYGALQKLQSDVDGLKCKMPPTVPVQWPQLKAYNPDAAAAAAWAAQQYNNDCGC